MDESVPISLLPKQFGRYRILSKVGRGGMGTVYLAQDSQLGRQVALKVPHLTATNEPAVLERFYREARAAATIDHPYICPVYDVGSIDGVPYLTMAYIEGRPLAELLDRGKPQAQHNAAAVVRRLAQALQEAHQKGVVHRDLKPANIIINQRREPVITDFGLAKQAGEQPLTHDGSLVGTPAYMAPEQVRGDLEVVGPLCDIYSLGVILYELLTGCRPYDGPIYAILHQILQGTPAPPSVLRPHVDGQLEAICLKAMARNPAERYPSMAELAAALADYLQRDMRMAAAAGDTSVSLGRGDHLAASLLMRPSASTATEQPFQRGMMTGVGRPWKSVAWDWLPALVGVAALLFLTIIVLVRTTKDNVRERSDAPDLTVSAPEAKPPVENSATDKAEPKRGARHPVGTYALRFDGSKSRVGIPKSSFKYYGDYPLTIETIVTPELCKARHVVVCDLGGWDGLSLEFAPGVGWSFLYRRRDEVNVAATHKGPVIVGQRTHVAAVVDRDQRELRLYVDGRLGESVAPFRGYKESGFEVTLGADPNNGNLFHSFYRGLMHQVRISRVARYSQDFSPPAVLTTDNDTLVLYDFNEGEGDELHDASDDRKLPARIVEARWVKLGD